MSVGLNKLLSPSLSFRLDLFVPFRRFFSPQPNSSVSSWEVNCKATKWFYSLTFSKTGSLRNDGSSVFFSSSLFESLFSARACAASEFRFNSIFLESSFFFHDEPKPPAYFERFGFSFFLGTVSFAPEKRPPVWLSPKNAEGSNSRFSSSRTIFSSWES